MDLVGGPESLRAAAEPGLAVRVARVEKLAVQALEHLPVDELAVMEAEFGEAGAAPSAWRLAALVGGR